MWHSRLGRGLFRAGTNLLIALYREDMEKVNIAFHDNGTVSFQHRKILRFVPEMSVDRNTRIVLPNIPLLVSCHTLQSRAPSSSCLLLIMASCMACPADAVHARVQLVPAGAVRGEHGRAHAGPQALYAADGRPAPVRLRRHPGAAGAHRVPQAPPPAGADGPTAGGE